MSGLFAGTPFERPVTCKICEQPLDGCRCPRDQAGAVCLPKDQPVRVRREKRRGAWVTVITGLDATATDLPAMAKEFKKTLGVGGSVTSGGTSGGAAGARESAIELQGDQCDHVLSTLRSLGYSAKRAGG